MINLLRKTNRPLSPWHCSEGANKTCPSAARQKLNIELNKGPLTPLTIPSRQDRQTGPKCAMIPPLPLLNRRSRKCPFSFLRAGFRRLQVGPHRLGGSSSSQNKNVKNIYIYNHCRYVPNLANAMPPVGQPQTNANRRRPCEPTQNPCVPT